MESVGATPMTPRDLKRFVSFIRVTDSCWEWAGAHTQDGYGVFSLGDKTRRAHRVAYELFEEPILPTLTIDHLCRNRGCVNPDHLEPVSVRENTLRGETIPGANARKAYCKHGHPFDEENTLVSPDGTRACRECSRRRSLAYWRRKRFLQKEAQV